MCEEIGSDAGAAVPKLVPLVFISISFLMPTRADLDVNIYSRSFADFSVTLPSSNVR